MKTAALHSFLPVLFGPYHVSAKMHFRNKNYNNEKIATVHAMFSVHDSRINGTKPNDHW